MRYLDLTFPHPAENLACDEALLELCENGYDSEIIRFWEPQDYFVVLGYSNKFKEEIIVDQCQQLNIPIYRRISGGGTVLQGPGCLNYSLILKISDYLKNITVTNAYIMSRHKKSLEPMVNQKISIHGHTDLTIGNLKFSGNSQKRKKQYLLFHGTFLLDFDIPLMDKILRIPPKQPAYRQNRSHTEFLMNLNIPVEPIKQTLLQTWKAHDRFQDTPRESIEYLVKSKYSNPDWNLKL